MIARINPFQGGTATQVTPAAVSLQPFAAVGLPLGLGEGGLGFGVAHPARVDRRNVAVPLLIRLELTAASRENTGRDHRDERQVQQRSARECFDMTR